MQIMGAFFIGGMASFICINVIYPAFPFINIKILLVIQVFELTKAFHILGGINTPGYENFPISNINPCCNSAFDMYH